MRGRFIGEVIVLQCWDWWIIEQPFRYEADSVVVRVPAGFVTDFASTPRALWAVAPPDSYEYSAAAAVHDRLYETHERSKAEADAIFFEAMAVHDTPLWKRRVMWWAVHLFGGSAYRTGRARQAERLRVDAARRGVAST